MRASLRLLRLWRIYRVFRRHGLDELLLSITPLAPLKRWRRRPRLDRGERGVRIRLTLEELGPVFVKFGQMLSTRPDLLPEDIIRELARLQDRVPPFESATVREILHRSYGQDPDEVFAEFDAHPLASASIAQVHAARLRDGRAVVLKVVRPGIDAVIRHDVELLHLAADFLERHWSEGKRLRPRAVVAEYEKVIFDELDLLREGANASQLRRNFLDSEILYVPEIYWSYTRREVLVMERIHGIPIGDLTALRRAGVNLKRLSERGVRIFFTQVFRDSFFHADMHPGNIFVDAGIPHEPRYIAVDFGIMGTLNPVDQHYLAENFLAFFRRDYRRVAELHIESGWVPTGTRVDEFESAIRTVCEPIFDRPLRDISFGGFLLSLFQTARRFQMEVQPQLVLLQKTLLHVEGLGRQLDPDLDLWKTAAPFLENWMRERLGPQGAWHRLQTNLPRWALQAPELPDLLHHALRQLARSEGQHPPAPALERFRQEWKQSQRQQQRRLVGAALLISGAILGVGEPLAWLAAVSGLWLLIRDR